MKQKKSEYELRIYDHMVEEGVKIAEKRVKKVHNYDLKVWDAYPERVYFGFGKGPDFMPVADPVTVRAHGIYLTVYTNSENQDCESLHGELPWD